MTIIENSHIYNVQKYEVNTDEYNQIGTCNVFEILDGILILKYVNEQGGVIVKGIFKHWNYIAMTDEDE